MILPKMATSVRATRDRRRAAWQAVALGAGVIVVFAVAGQQILKYLGIDVAITKQVLRRGFPAEGPRTRRTFNDNESHEE